MLFFNTKSFSKMWMWNSPDNRKLLFRSLNQHSRTYRAHTFRYLHTIFFNINYIFLPLKYIFISCDVICSLLFQYNLKL